MARFVERRTGPLFLLESNALELVQKVEGLAVCAVLRPLLQTSMKRLFRICACTLSLCAGAADRMASLAQPDANVGIAIDQVGVLVYPPMMTLNAVFSGEVSAAISVDANGRLVDCLITTYTRKEFAAPALAAIKRWKYQPAKVNNRPTGARANLVFEFTNQGVVVQTLPGAIVHAAFFHALDEYYEYKPWQLKDLDRIPTPSHVVSPSVNTTEKGHDVVVEFYIDEEGRVRMPAVSRESADDVYAAAAIAAVEQWRFEPPLRKGRPVLVLAEQQFKFRSKP